MSGFPVEGIDLAPGRVPDQDLPPFAAFFGRSGPSTGGSDLM
jgi:hypothetical protein